MSGRKESICNGCGCLCRRSIRGGEMAFAMPALGQRLPCHDEALVAQGQGEVVPWAGEDGVLCGTLEKGGWGTGL